MRHLINATLLRLSAAGLLSSMTLCALAADEPREPQAIPVTIPYRSEWIELPPAASIPGGDVTTYAAVRFLRVLDPAAGPSEDVKWPYTCAREQVRHEFRLEKQEFLLGEPILIEYRVSVKGEGEWQEWTGGNYRSRNRDDNFLFLMRHEDGTWVPPGLPYSGLPGGGLMGAQEVSQDKPLSKFLAAQRWCPIERPGRYDLYCIYQSPGPFDVETTADTFRARIPEEVLRTHTVNEHGRLYKAGSEEISSEYCLMVHRKEAEFVPSPLPAHMPDDLKAFLKDPALPPVLTYTRESVNDEISRHLWNATVFARIPITIVPGSPDQLRAMTAAWTQRGAMAVTKVRSNPGPEETAVLDALLFSRQTCFLPAIREWIQKDNALLWGFDFGAGLQLNPSPDAIALLLEFPRGDSIDLGSVPCHDTNPNVMPALIALLSHEDDAIRRRALHVLRRNAGGYFFADPGGGPLEHLSDAQLTQARELWRAWWERNRADVHCFRRGVWGYIDTHGEFAIPPKFTSAWPFQGGFAKVSLGACTHVDESQRFPIDHPGVRQPQQPPPESDNVALRPVRVGAMWGYIDRKGEMIVPPQFDDAHPFSDGRAAVRVTGDEGVRYGYIDPSGHMIIPPRFPSAYDFSEGLAAVCVASPYFHFNADDYHVYPEL